MAQTGTTTSTPISPGSDAAQWLAGRTAAVGNPKWDSHDNTINTTVSAYKSHLQSLGNAPQFDARVIKAMLWVESGANDPAWNTKPMQIGVPGDPGLRDFFDPARPGTSLIPPTMKAGLNALSAVTSPTANIQAGTGYLLMRIGTFAMTNFNKPGGVRKMVMVKAGDTIERLAKLHQSTTLSILGSNPTVTANSLRIGQGIIIAQAELRWTPTSWRAFTADTIAQNYNGGGDKNYSVKLAHCMKLLGL